jgi:hypothetical protein
MSRTRPAIASDDWMHEQQLRAELEAEAWRRLRRELATPEPLPPPAAAPAPAPATPEFDHHRSGSTLLKALVRFGLAAFVSYLAYIAAMDSGLGEFEAWLAIGSAFMVTLALSMFGVAREFVHMLAETMRWVIFTGAGIGLLWLATHWPQT